MRSLAEADGIRRFMREVGRRARVEARVYFTGGVSAVLMGWRHSTIDLDLAIVPDRDEILRELAAIKEELRINVELASPADFIPALPGWEDRSPFIAREGEVAFHHYDFFAQALAKIERGHAQDLGDITAMLDHGLVVPAKLRELFAAIEPGLFRYPAIDPASFRQALEQALKGR